MNISEAIKKAFQILTEENVHPSVNYQYSPAAPMVLPGYTLDPAYRRALLESNRRQKPRLVYENPTLFVFKSLNFDLLIKIFSQISDTDRPRFISAVLELVSKTKTNRTPNVALVAEFCVRTGHLKELLSASAVPQFPAWSLLDVSEEIEEMIALNFNLFSESELESMPSGLAPLRTISYRQTYLAIGTRGGGLKTNNPHYREGFDKPGKAITASIDRIVEECRQARFWYLKGALQELPNLEIESDKLKVESFLVKLGFNTTMVEALNAAETDYKSTATPFELKNCLGHLRSFLEHLHRESAKAISTAAGNPVTDKWGSATLYLREKGYFTSQHEVFITSLYTLLSDESVHPLTAEREYARLLRNVTIEYGVMFLTMLDKHGVDVRKP